MMVITHDLSILSEMADTSTMRCCTRGSYAEKAATDVIIGAPRSIPTHSS